MKKIAIIPARGGSKRIPRKNLADLGGKPLLAWAVEAAIGSDCFDRVLVSTDDEEIAETARRFGAEAPFLRSGHADDYATSSQATLLALAQGEEEFKENYDIVCQLLPTVPFRRAGHIRAALDRFASSGAPSQISCTAFEWQNPWWAATVDEDGTPRPLFPDNYNIRSQDLPGLYGPTGAVWLARADVLKAEKTFYASGHHFFPIDWRAAIDVDNPEDLELARALFAAEKHEL